MGRSNTITLKLKREYFEFAEILILIVISVAPYISVTGKIIVYFVLIMVNAFNIVYLPKSYYLTLLLMAIPSLLDVLNVSEFNSYSGNNFLYPISFFVGALIASKYRIDSFIYILEKVLFFLAILSMVGMGIYYFFPAAIPSFPAYVFYGLKHRTLYFFNFIYANGFLMVRNSGIAWEPGVFQILMNLGLSITISNKKYIDYKRITIYTLAVIFTRSTTGLIILVFNILLLVHKKKSFIFLLIIVFAFFSSDIYNIAIYQRNFKWIGSLAFNNRVMPSINAFLVGVKHPFGIGSTGYNFLYNFQEIGSFDSYTQVLMRYGYGLSAFIIYALTRIYKKHWNIAVVMAVSMLSEPMWNCVLFTMIYFIYLNEARFAQRVLD